MSIHRINVWGKGRTATCILNLGTGCRWVVNVTAFPWKGPCFLLDRRPVGPLEPLWSWWRDEKCLSLLGIKCRLSSLVTWLKCTVWDQKDKIGAHLGSRGNMVRKCDERRKLLLLLLLLVLIIIIRYECLLSQDFRPGTSLEPAVNPTTQASRFTLQ